MSLRLTTLIKGVVPLLRTVFVRPLLHVPQVVHQGFLRPTWPAGLTLNPRALLEEAVLRVSTYWRKRTKLRKHKRKQRLRKLQRKSVRKQRLKGLK